MDTLSLIGRTQPLFESDIKKHEDRIRSIITNSRFLVIGGQDPSVKQCLAKSLNGDQALFTLLISTKII